MLLGKLLFGASAQVVGVSKLLVFCHALSLCIANIPVFRDEEVTKIPFIYARRRVDKRSASTLQLNRYVYSFQHRRAGHVAPLETFQLAAESAKR